MNVACDYEAPMQMLTTEKYIASRACKPMESGIIKGAIALILKHYKAHFDL